jgi:UDP-3-O-[3-hydroxymyristoyl] glucosamine N-acyltransferase
MITAPEQLGVASDSDITFIGNKNTKNFGLHLKLAVVNEDISIEPGDNRALKSKNADLAMSQVLELLLSLYFMLTSTQLQLLINQLLLDLAQE